jgi:essential nuclear protein 1
MPRAVKPQKQRHDPLHVDLEQDDDLQRFGRVSKPGKRKARKVEDEDDAEAVRRLSCFGNLGN